MNTTAQTPDHPPTEELAAFALGKETPNAQTIAEHVANCPRCETLIAQTPRDTFLDILNKAKAGGSVTGPEVPRSIPASADELPEDLRRQTKYTFLRKLGGGGMGIVYLAEHNLMRRKVAVKLIPPELIGNPAVRERFLREVVSAAALEHPNVVRAYSAEAFGTHMVFEMEYVDGKDLGEVIKRKGPLSVAHAVNYIRQSAQALQHGMLKSLVHRDIKPGNLMLTRGGNVKVADFGLAKFNQEADKDRDRSLTGMNAMMGTPDYMAPEQARNAKSADIRADIYSLGCTFHYLLTGQPPFMGESIADLMFKHWQEPRPDVRRLRDDVPAELSQFIQRMMATQPGNRPQTPKEVADWLTKFAGAQRAKAETVAKPKDRTVASLEKQTDKSLQLALELPLDDREFSPAASGPKKKWPVIAGVLACLLIVFAIMTAFGLFKAKPKADVAGRVAGEVAEVEIAGGVRMKLCWVPAGTATLGSPIAEQGRQANEAEHEFSTRGFWLGKYTVTQGEWDALMGNNPSWFSKDGAGKNMVVSMNTSRFPVEQISWDECQMFLKKVNAAAKTTGPLGAGKFVLPHEDEWEYACRGGKGNKQPFYFGPELNGVQANCDGNYPYGTTEKGPYSVRTTEVGSYEKLAPHPWGLCDMSGNVYQWCEGENCHVVRGGSWGFSAVSCRSASRYEGIPSSRYGLIGCRVAFKPD